MRNFYYELTIDLQVFKVICYGIVYSYGISSAIGKLKKFYKKDRNGKSIKFSIEEIEGLNRTSCDDVFEIGQKCIDSDFKKPSVQELLKNTERKIHKIY